VPEHELGGQAAVEAIRRSGVPREDIGEVVMGHVGGVGPDAFNARRVALAAGLSKGTPAYNVNRLCGSGLQAIWSAAMQLWWRNLDAAVAGGDESMTRMPFYDYSGQSTRLLRDITLMDGTPMMLTDPWCRVHMGITAENVAEKYDVSRAEQDEFALESQRRAASNAAKAAFAEEIVPVEIGGNGPGPSQRTSSRGPRPRSRCSPASKRHSMALGR
jgi:acetyl-CoA C-acetyltransferase